MVLVVIGNGAMFFSFSQVPANKKAIISVSDNKNVDASRNTSDTLSVEKIDKGFEMQQHFKNRGGGIDGLKGGVNIAVSQDGRDVYVAGYGDDAVGIFSYQEDRDLLLFRGVLKSTREVTLGPSGFWDIAISPDGNDIYITEYKGDALSFFKKNSSGDIVFIRSYTNKINETMGLNGPRELVISPDGKNIYVVNEDDNSLTIFSRDIETGILNFVSIIRNGKDSMGGLSGARGITINKSGDKVYITGFKSNSLVEFDRNIDSGSLELVHIFNDGVDGVDGLLGACTVAVSTDGKKVFVTGFKEDALAVFAYKENNILSFERVIKNGVKGIKGLKQIFKVITDDKGHVYVSGYGDSAFSEFAYTTVDGTESLTQISVFREGVGGVQGIDGAWGIAAHPNGQLFVSGFKSNSLAMFGISETTRLLVPKYVLRDTEGQTTGLFAAFGISISPMGENVYVNGIFDNSMGIFFKDDLGKLVFSSEVVKGIGSTKLLDEEAIGSVEISGITGAWKSAISPDGKNVYITKYGDNALVVYQRNILNGTLHYVETLLDNVNGIDGLSGAYDVEVSYDGKNVYVTGFKEDAITVFNRDNEGNLTFGSILRDSADNIDGLNGAFMIAISPDNQNVYVTSKFDNSLSVFDRNLSDGSLVHKGLLKNNIEGISGLNGAFGVAVTPSGTRVYVTGNIDSAIVIFDRKSDGSLVYNSSIKNGIRGVLGLDDAREIVVSPDETYIYVTANSSLVIFKNNEDTSLPVYHTIFQNEKNGITGLKGAWGLAVSEDNKNIFVTGYYDNSLLVFSRTDMDEENFIE